MAAPAAAVPIQNLNPIEEPYRTHYIQLLTTHYLTKYFKDSRKSAFPWKDFITAAGMVAAVAVVVFLELAALPSLLIFLGISGMSTSLGRWIIDEPLNTGEQVVEAFLITPGFVDHAFQSRIDLRNPQEILRAHAAFTGRPQ